MRGRGSEAPGETEEGVLGALGAGGIKEKGSWSGRCCSPPRTKQVARVGACIGRVGVTSFQRSALPFDLVF